MAVDSLCSCINHWATSARLEQASGNSLPLFQNFCPFATRKGSEEQDGCPLPPGSEAGLNIYWKPIALTTALDETLNWWGDKGNELHLLHRFFVCSKSTKWATESGNKSNLPIHVNDNTAEKIRNDTALLQFFAVMNCYSTNFVVLSQTV